MSRQFLLLLLLNPAPCLAYKKCYGFHAMGLVCTYKENPSLTTNHRLHLFRSQNLAGAILAIREGISNGTNARGGLLIDDKKRIRVTLTQVSPTVSCIGQVQVLLLQEGRGTKKHKTRRKIDHKQARLSIP